MRENIALDADERLRERLEPVEVSDMVLLQKENKTKLIWVLHTRQRSTLDALFARLDPKRLLALSQNGYGYIYIYIYPPTSSRARAC